MLGKLDDFVINDSNDVATVTGPMKAEIIRDGEQLGYGFTFPVTKCWMFGCRWERDRRCHAARY